MGIVNLLLFLVCVYQMISQFLILGDGITTVERYYGMKIAERLPLIKRLKKGLKVLRSRYGIELIELLLFPNPKAAY